MTATISFSQVASKGASGNAYTDAPSLHSNLLLGSLQLLVWLFFHPSAWRNYLNHIKPGLSPDFVLTELNAEQWRHPALRRLLVMGYGILPLLNGLLQGLIFGAIMGLTGDQILASTLLTIAYTLTTSLAVGTTVSVATGLVYGVVISLTASFMPNLATILALHPILSESSVRTPTEIAGIARTVVLGLAAGVAGNITITMANKKANYSLIRQVGGIVAGFLPSSILLGAAYAVASGMVLGLKVPGQVGGAVGMNTGIVYGLAGGLLFTLAYSLSMVIRTRSWRRSLMTGMAVGLVGGFAYALTVSIDSNNWVNSEISDIARGIGGGLLFGGLFAFSYILVGRLTGTYAGAIAGAVVGGIGWFPIARFIFRLPVPLWPTPFFILVAILLGLTLHWWRTIILYPGQLILSNLLLHRDEQRTPRFPSALRWHAAFWDEHQRWPLLGLDEHLVLVVERDHIEGQAAISYLIGSHQRWAVHAAQVELEARGLEACIDIQAIANIHLDMGTGELAGPASTLLRSFSRTSHDVWAALSQESAYNQRLALRAIEDRLDSLLRELNRSNEPYTARFRVIAVGWLQTVTNYRCELAATMEARQEINSPYVIGVPLTTQQEIFVGRTDISARIENLLLNQRRLPLLLYGQRRMGKTSLLNNLGRLLPTTILPLFIDLQGPASQASNHSGFLYNLARGMINSAQRQRGLTLPPLSREALATDPFTDFDEWLDKVEQALGKNTALLALDEFEALEIPIQEGRFNETAVMNMFRHLIQHRSHFKILLAGSHSLEEFGHWASYLINVQIVHLSYLNEAEARQLIERPTHDFTLHYEPGAGRRVLELTRGHPFLVQLLCSEIIALKNDQDAADRRLARFADVEAAVPVALNHGSFFFADIQHNQLDPTALSLLRFIAVQGEGAVIGLDSLISHFPTHLEQTLALLVRRELIELNDSGYRFQVELIRRWFARP